MLSSVMEPDWPSTRHQIAAYPLVMFAVLIQPLTRTCLPLTSSMGNRWEATPRPLGGAFTFRIRRLWLPDSKSVVSMAYSYPVEPVFQYQGRPRVAVSKSRLR